jgi:hypothetical protein
MKENINGERNLLVDKLIVVIEESRKKHREYKKALGEFQQMQREKSGIENQLLLVGKLK